MLIQFDHGAAAGRSRETSRHPGPAVSAPKQRRAGIRKDVCPELFLGVTDPLEDRHQDSVSPLENTH